jgi:hypothetical protein
MCFSEVVRSIGGKDVTFQLSYAVVYNGGICCWIFPANEEQTPRGA